MKNIKVLIDLQHPAHLHFFRNLITRLRNEGHTIRITGRDKDILIKLADKYNLEFEVFGVAQKGVLNLGRELLFRQWRLHRIINEFRPDLMMAVAGTYISLVGKLMGVPTYVFYDTEHATLSNLLAYPFATCIYVPRCYGKKIRWRHVRYNGYHELAYLLPRYFKPDPAVLKKVGLREGEIFIIVRFVSWGAAHDIGKQGLTVKDKMEAIKELSRHGRVLISAEGDLPKKLEPMRLRFNIARIHDLMAHSALIFGESGTMPSEGAIMGVPGIYINPLRLSYLEEQEQDYGIVFNFHPEKLNEAIQKSIAILKDYDRDYWRAKARCLIEDKIDVTDLLHHVATQRPYWKRQTCI